MGLAPWVVLGLALGQSNAPFVRSRVEAQDTSTQCLYWTAADITWHLDSQGNGGGTGAHPEFDAIRRSFQSWQDIFASCGNLTLEEGAIVNDRKVGYSRDGTNRNLVLFRDKDCTATVSPTDNCWKDDTCANTYDCWEDNDNTIAITLTTYDERSGIIYDSDISFNAARFTFTSSDGPTCVPPVYTNCVYTDVQNTATHEIGHFVGLDHTQALRSTMNPSAPPGEISKRTIDSGSSSFVCEAYPKGRASQACLHPVISDEAGPKGSDSGCAAAGGTVATLPALAAWALLRARRRSRSEVRS